MKKFTLLAIMFAAVLTAQTITGTREQGRRAASSQFARTFTLSIDGDRIDAIKLYIAGADSNEATVTEADVTNAATFAFIRGEINKLVKSIQVEALRQAGAFGRPDLLPPALATQVLAEKAAAAAREPLESTGVSVEVVVAP